MHSETIEEQFDDIAEFEELLDEAERRAESDWDTNFVADMRSRYEKFGPRTFLSVAQRNHLERIAGGER